MNLAGLESLAEHRGGRATFSEEGAVHHYKCFRTLSSAEFVRGQSPADDEHGLDHDAEAIVHIVRVESSWLSVVGLIS